MTWHVEDARQQGRWASIASYATEDQANRQIAAWRARDARGKRPDIHQLMPHLIAVETRLDNAQDTN